MRILNLAFVAASLVALQAAGQSTNGNSTNGTIYSDYNYCQGITPVKQTYQPMVSACVWEIKSPPLSMEEGSSFAMETLASCENQVLTLLSLST
jgi:hypothetical protein